MSQYKYATAFSDLTASRLLQKGLQEGDVFFVEEDKRFYTYHDGDFVLMEGNPGAQVEMKIIDMNAQLIAQLPALTHEELCDKMDDIIDFSDRTHGRYFMLLNNDLRYYTIFTKRRANEIGDDYGNIAEAVVDCLFAVGDKIKAIDVIDDHIEIWVQHEDREPNCFVFFDYTDGVVTYEE